MRLIFFFLLVVNSGIAVWGLFFLERSSDVSVAAPVVTGKAVESTEVYLNSPDSLEGASEDSGMPREEVSASVRDLCELIGPFDGDQPASAFQEKLSAIDIPATVEQVPLPAGKSFWVHLAPSESVSAAYNRLADLQAQGIESYVIGKGELKNAVSLGVFTYEHLAKNKADELKKAGLAPIIKTMERTQIEIWVMIQPEFAEKISEITWSRLLEGMTSQERRQNFCLPVASLDNFH